MIDSLDKVTWAPNTWSVLDIHIFLMKDAPVPYILKRGNSIEQQFCRAILLNLEGKSGSPSPIYFESC